MASNKHERLRRELDRQRGVNEHTITPAQYTMLCLIDDVSKEHIESSLQAWGGQTDNCNFSDPRSLDLQSENIVSAKGWKRRFGIQDQSCRLNMYKPKKRKVL